MADLSEVRIGSKLVLTVEVTHEATFKGRSHPFGVQGLFGVALGQEAVWLDKEIIKAAEHIPAPRIFKRGDWVKMHLQTQSVDHTKRHGIVAGDSDAGDNVPVLWPQCLNSQFIRRDLLEPDEAPE